MDTASAPDPRARAPTPAAGISASRSPASTPGLGEYRFRPKEKRGERAHLPSLTFVSVATRDRHADIAVGDKSRLITVNR